jgi:putative acetyltransferase
MDTRPTLRSFEPGDAAAVSALMGRIGTFEGTLQLPDVPVASRIEMLQRPEPTACKLVAVDGENVVGIAGLHAAHPGLRRSHVRAWASPSPPNGRAEGWVAS